MRQIREGRGARSLAAGPLIRAALTLAVMTLSAANSATCWRWRIDSALTNSFALSLPFLFSSASAKAWSNPRALAASLRLTYPSWLVSSCGNSLLG